MYSVVCVSHFLTFHVHVRLHSNAAREQCGHSAQQQVFLPSSNSIVRNESNLRRAGMHLYVDGEVEGVFHRFVVRHAVSAGAGRPVVMNVAHFLPMEF